MQSKSISRSVPHASPSTGLPTLPRTIPAARTDASRGALPRQQATARPQAMTAMQEARKMVDTYVSEDARRALFGRGRNQTEEVEASISGCFPTWINGSFLANGGADYTGMKHMFDGYAMLCKFRFSEGRVFGSQQFVKSKAYSHFSSTGKMMFREFATDVPATTLSEQLVAVLKTMALMVFNQDSSTDNPSVNVLPLPDGTVLAVSETRPSVYRVNPGTLEIIQQHKYDDSLPGPLTTAHPKTMPDGTIVNFTRSLPLGGFHIFKQDPVTLKRTQIAFIRDRNPMAPCWVHDFAASANHMVIVENPVFMSMASLVVGAEASHAFMNWKPEEGTRVHVVPLQPGNEPVRTFKAPAFFSFHTANAYEEAGQLHVDLSVYDDPTILKDLCLDPLREFPGKNVSKSSLRRISIPLSSGSQELGAPQQLMLDESAHGDFTEFPAVSPLKRGLKHRYVWGNGAVRPTNMGNALAKFDVESGEVIMWHEDGSLPGEPVFLPAPGATLEDDGVVLSVVMSAAGTSFVLALDAATMKELGRAKLPYAVPYRFHGSFLQAK